jgi:hypothetical protein
MKTAVKTAETTAMTTTMTTTCPFTRSQDIPRGVCRNTSRGLRRLAALALLCSGLAFAMPTTAAAQESFKTPEAAADALASAARTGDRAGIIKVLGPEGADIASSGDPVADADQRKRFVETYDAKHQIKMDGDANATLIIGAEDFPVPLPLVRKGDAWRFDTAAGRAEILARRIGRNELAAIQSSLAYVDAQNDYAAVDRTGAGSGVYAQRIVSSTGKKDGLYWPASAGDEQSPLGELVAQATRQGYRTGEGRTPFHGYYFKILTKQGPAARGGEANYVVNGKMIGGFGLVAYPAEYRNSGVMTFIVNHDGVVFQKDLGPDTGELVERMTSFNPDQSWTKVTDAEPLQ